jgi:transcription elongation GreA/GreB family factor
VPAENTYLSAGLHHALVLGPVTHAGTARRWYLSSEARRLTADFRSRQLRQEQEAEEQRKTEERDAQKRFAVSELGRLREQLRYLDELKAAGKLPDPSPPEPAIRIGRNIKT